jgi:hypothetical protein
MVVPRAFLQNTVMMGLCIEFPYFEKQQRVLVDDLFIDSLRICVDSSFYQGHEKYLLLLEYTIFGNTVAAIYMDFFIVL